MKTIALISAKGGTGKTTTALNLAVALAESKQRTVLVDLDPQGAIGLSLGRQDSQWEGLTEVLLGQASVGEVVVSTKLEPLQLLPRGRLDPVDGAAYEQALRTNGALAGVVDQLSGQFDYAILDTPSGLGDATRAALKSADYALVVMQAHPLALRSIGQVLRVIEHVQEQQDGRPEVVGVLATMVAVEQAASLDVMRQMWTGFAGILDTYIPQADVFLTASHSGLPVGFLGGPVTPEAQRFESLAREIEQTIAQLEQTGENNDRPQRDLL